MARNTNTAPAKAAPAKVAKDTATPAKVAEAPTPKPNQCRCGCGEATTRPTATYRPGHDARHAGNVGRTLVARGADLTTKERDAILAELPTPALRAKASALYDRKVEKANESDAKREARKAAEAAAKAAFKAAMAEAGF